MNLALRIVPALLPVLMLGIGVGKAQNFGDYDDPPPVAAIDTAVAEGCSIERAGGLAVVRRPAPTGSASRISGARSAPPCDRPSAPQKKRRHQVNSGDFTDCKAAPPQEQRPFATSAQLDDAQARSTYYDCYADDDGYVSEADADAAARDADNTAMFNEMQETAVEANAERTKRPAGSATKVTITVQLSFSSDCDVRSARA